MVNDAGERPIGRKRNTYIIVHLMKRKKGLKVNHLQMSKFIFLLVDKNLTCALNKRNFFLFCDLNLKNARALLHTHTHAHTHAHTYLFIY